MNQFFTEASTLTTGGGTYVAHVNPGTIHYLRVTSPSRLQSAPHLTAGEFGCLPRSVKPRAQAFGDEWREAVDELQRISTYEDDWDGTGSAKPNDQALSFAQKLARELPAAGVAPPTRVVAGVNGTILFEWHSNEGYAEMEVLGWDDAEVHAVRG